MERSLLLVCASQRVICTFHMIVGCTPSATAASGRKDTDGRASAETSRRSHLETRKYGHSRRLMNLKSREELRVRMTPTRQRQKPASALRHTQGQKTSGRLSVEI